MNFKLWIEEQEAGLNSGFPDKGMGELPETPASNGVKRTGLQPQVDAQALAPKSQWDQDKVGAIDADLERLKLTYADEDANSESRVGRFRQLLDGLINQWKSVKMSDGDMLSNDEDAGLGQTMGDQNFLQMMRQNPNMAPIDPNQQRQGPGTFGDQGHL